MHLTAFEIEVSTFFFFYLSVLRAKSESLRKGFAFPFFVFGVGTNPVLLAHLAQENK